VGGAVEGRRRKGGEWKERNGMWGGGRGGGRRTKAAAPWPGEPFKCRNNKTAD
jgi:hypothetical protein